LRRAARAAHRHSFGGDDIAWVGTAVILVLEPAARVALTVEGARIALLPCGPAS
jgi:hypothetical protein